MIFNIQKCSIHDGDGLRTLVFFKGCPLHCPWCANPESQSYEKEIMEFPRKCIGCGACVQICSQSAISVIDNRIKINRTLCRRCFRCTDICYAESKKVVGRDMDVDALYEEIIKDYSFYQQYGGGVTFSGGEPLTHSVYLTEILRKCKENGINTVVETCGYGNFELFKPALAYIDKLFIDIKIMDDSAHKSLTGVSNQVILENIKKISASGVPITIRTPVVPTCNDSAENICAIASWIKELPSVQDYELLPYHNLGLSKYAALGRPYSLNHIAPPDDQQMISLVKRSNQILQPFGKQCYYIKNNKKEIFT